MFDSVMVSGIEAETRITQRTMRRTLAIMGGFANPESDYQIVPSQPKIQQRYEEYYTNDSTSPSTIKRVNRHLERHSKCTLTECRHGEPDCEPGWRVVVGGGIGHNRYKQTNLCIPPRWYRRHYWQYLYNRGNSLQIRSKTDNVVSADTLEVKTDEVKVEVTCTVIDNFIGLRTNLQANRTPSQDVKAVREAATSVAAQPVPVPTASRECVICSSPFEPTPGFDTLWCSYECQVEYKEKPTAQSERHHMMMRDTQEVMERKAARRAAREAAKQAATLGENIVGLDGYKRAKRKPPREIPPVPAMFSDDELDAMLAILEDSPQQAPLTAVR